MKGEMLSLPGFTVLQIYDARGDYKETKSFDTEDEASEYATTNGIEISKRERKESLPFGDTRRCFVTSTQVNLAVEDDTFDAVEDTLKKVCAENGWEFRHIDGRWLHCTINGREKQWRIVSTKNVPTMSTLADFERDIKGFRRGNRKNNSVEARRAAAKYWDGIRPFGFSLEGD